MDVANGNDQFATCTLAPPHNYFPKPQLTTMTIARSSSHSTGFAPLPRVPMMRTTSTGANPMMRVTLPKELSDDPLASPIGAKPLPSFFSESVAIEKQREPETSQEPETTAKSSGFANVFTRRRQSSIEKKPPMVPMAPMLRRTTSAPIKNNSLLSKMAPMLKRVVSNTKSVPEDDDEDQDHDSRESLLMLMQVPDIQRVSLVPLMMASHDDY